jgi:2-iminobutanoate/2-iminopropanoate deaminase
MAAPVGPYSPFLSIGNLVAISGQLGLVDGALVPGFDAQADAVLVNLQAQLDAAGLAKTDVIKTMVFLTDLGQFPSLNDKYAEFFGDHRPARSTIGVAALPLGGLVEIEAWAVRAG